jgi:hypothetical protein
LKKGRRLRTGPTVLNSYFPGFPAAPVLLIVAGNNNAQKSEQHFSGLREKIKKRTCPASIPFMYLSVFGNRKSACTKGGSMRQSIQRFAAMVSLGVCIILCSIFGAAADATDTTSLQTTMDSYFTALQKEFDRIAGAQAAKSTRLKSIDWHFVKSLKANQVIYSLIRTNSKGVVICEVIRGEKPERKTRSIADQRWFTEVARTFGDYYGFMKEEETGRYYLFWSRAVMATPNRGNQKFIGAVVAKIDLWDCFHKISSGTEEPFLVRIGSLSLYNHKWDKEIASVDDPLTIPGVDRISVRHARPAAPPPAPADTTLSAAASQPPTSAQSAIAAEQKQQQKQSKISKLRKLVIVYWVIVLILLLFAGFRFVVWLRLKLLQRKIDREDII